MEGGWPPFLKVYGGEWRSFVPANANGPTVFTPFSVGALAWNQVGQGAFYSLLKIRSDNAYCVPLPCPIPSIIRMAEWRWGPYADGGGKLYALSRLLAMMALAVQRDEPDGEHFQTLLCAAKMAYRAHLTCLAIPGKTYVHEMFHTYRMAEVYLSAALAPGVLAIAFIDNVRRALKGSHCLSGCGQEKMSTLWFAGVGHSALLLPSSDGSATMTHQAAPRGATTPFPTGLNQPVGRQTSWGSSTALVVRLRSQEQGAAILRRSERGSQSGRRRPVKMCACDGGSLRRPATRAPLSFAGVVGVQSVDQTQKL
jgi:hypothetical protein